MGEFADLVAQISTCTRCALSKGRTKTVPGEGSTSPEVMFIGEGPGFHEDQQGRPFVGPAGQLLDQLLAFIGLKREDVFITNMLKCRPPNNRDPLPGEVEACRPYLEKQIELLNPKVIATLGRHALTYFFPQETISKAHGKARRWNGLIVYPLYHPAAALRQQSLRAVLENDFKALSELLNAPDQASPVDEVDEENQGRQMSMF